jgi:hypothetical protein
VGEFSHGSKYQTNPFHSIINRDDQHYSAWVKGYHLDETDSFVRPLPDYILAIPDMIQGLAFLSDRIFISKSYGRNRDSTLIVYADPLKEEPHSIVNYGHKI